MYRFYNNKRLNLHFLFLIIFISTNFLSGQVTHNVTFSKPELILKVITGGDSLEYAKLAYTGLQQMDDIGKPSLPVKYIKLIIPPDEEVDNIVLNITNKEKISLPGKIYPAQPGIITSIDAENPGFVKPDSTVYESDTPWPSEMVKTLRHGYFDGSNHIVTLAVCPFQYYPKSDRLEFFTNISFSLRFKSAESKAIYVPNRYRKNQEIYDAILNDIVDNPRDISAYSSPPNLLDSGVYPPYKPWTPLPSYEYVVITNQTLKPGFDKFVNWKRRKGLDIGVITVEEITNCSFYSNGDEISGIEDDAGKIRQYLYDGYHAGITVWALLAGDYNEIPRYGLQVNYKPEGSPNPWEKIPADLYFSEFNGDWNVDGDAFYGEPDEGEFGGDSPEFEPEIFVGRLLCIEEEDIIKWTDKILKYEQNPGNGNYDYLTRSFMIQGDQYQLNDHASIISQKLPMFTHEFMEEDDIYNPTSPLPNTVIDEMKTRYGLFSFLTHSGPIGLVTMSKDLNTVPGNRHNINSLDIWEGTSEIPDNGDGLDCLENFDYPSILYAMGCDNIPFDDYHTISDQRNIGEAFTVLTQSGGPAVLGYTRNAGFSPSRYLYEKFAEKLTESYNGTNESYAHIGQAYAVSKTYSDHKHNLSHNLIGCPETKIWLNEPQTFENIYITDNGSQITIDAGIDGCTICVCSVDESEAYHSVAVNTSNHTFTTEVRPIYITITKHNYIPFTNTMINGNVTWSGEMTVTEDITITKSGQLNLEAGTIVKMDEGVGIIVEQGYIPEVHGLRHGGEIHTYGTSDNPVKFIRYNPELAWDKIDIHSDCNCISETIFDGGTSNVIVRGRATNFTNCTFKNAVYGFEADCLPPYDEYNAFTLINCLIENNDYGIVAKYSDQGKIMNTTIRNNNYDGLNMYKASIGGSDGYDYCLFTENYIHNNGRYGINIGYGSSLWLGYYYIEGRNRIINNSSHEIYIGSYSNARLYGSDDIYQIGNNDIFDESLGYYVYNLAQTYNGEYYVSLTQKAEYNYWGTNSQPSASRFYGSVDYIPYMTTPQAEGVGASGAPMQIDLDESPSTKSILSEGLIQEIINDSSKSYEEKQRLIDTKQKMLELISQIKNNPDDLRNASRLNELYILLIDNDTDNKTGEKGEILNLISERRSKLENMPLEFLNTDFYELSEEIQAARLVGEVAMLIDINVLLKDKKYNEALSKTSKYDEYIKNSDNRREFLMHKLSALESVCEYNKALLIIEELREVVKESEIAGYTQPTYEIIEHSLLRKLGMDLKEINKRKTMANNETNETELIKTNSPLEFALHANYPNPFNPVTTIPFSIAEPSRVKIEVFNILGERVCVLVDKSYDTGQYKTKFDGKGFASGIYFIHAQMESDSFTSKKQFVRKIIFMK